MRSTIGELSTTRFLYTDTRVALLWLCIRLYVGWGWLSAGWEKFNDPAWVGPQVGTALSGFINGAIAQTTGAHPAVQAWYAHFLSSTVLPHLAGWSYLVVAGELLTGAALILGFLTGVTALIAMFMNLNFMLAGAVSLNPIWFTLCIFLVLAWRTAGYWGLDRVVLPKVARMLRLRQSY